MLTESFIAAILTPEKLDPAAELGIYIHEFQPIPALRSTFKKSSCSPNCLAVSDTHIFAAQADKAVVNVYSRERKNQEAIVPFSEKIHSITIAGDRDGAGILVLGTEGGRLILWELGTGRQVYTPQHHFKPTTCLSVDLTSNFLLSGSTDSRIFVWSIPGLLSFSVSRDHGVGEDLPHSPLRSLATHRAAITSLCFGHISGRNNIAVSTAEDKLCILWDYNDGTVLRTFLLEYSPLCLVLDPADRAAYVGYQDGSIQVIDFYDQMAISQRGDSDTEGLATVPPESDRWRLPDDTSSRAALCIQVSYDGTSLLSGHLDGKIHVWNVAKGRYSNRLVDFSASVTNLAFLPLEGFPTNAQTSKVKLNQVTKPRFESFGDRTAVNNGSVVPANYKFTARFMTDLPSLRKQSDNLFMESLSHASFPTRILEETAASFSSSQNFSPNADSSDLADLQAQNASLSARLTVATNREQGALAIIEERERREKVRKQEEEVKAARKKRRRMRQTQTNDLSRRRHMGEPIENGDGTSDHTPKDEQDLSSSTDEMSDSD